MKRFLIATAALVAAVCVLAALSLPSARRTLPVGSSDGTIPGILHVHTIRSDGRGTPDQVASEAARSGLKFVVFTDHGDATRPPDPPAYRAGVLCLDGVEISTNAGHYVAIGMAPAPYPLAGDARDVVDDVRRLGGFGIVAHPDSPKPALQWRDWAAPFDAIETLNLDTSWRRRLAWPGWRSRLRLAQALLTYPIRPSETIAALLQGTTAIYRWESIARRRRVVAIAGADAHAKLALRNVDPGDNRWSLPFPGYAAMFGTISVHVRPERPLTGDAARDATLLLRAIRGGHLYTAVDGLARPPALELDATNSHGTVHEGDQLAAGEPISLHVKTNAPADFTTNVWNGTQLVASRRAPEFTVDVGDKPGVYWVEVRGAGRAPVQWLASNPVYVRAADTRTELPVRPQATTSDLLFNQESPSGWRIEHDQTSHGSVETAPIPGGPVELRFGYELGGSTAAGQYVALTVDRPGGIAGEDRVALAVRADRAMRVSLQLRVPGEGGLPERWERSFYVDTFTQERTIFLDEFLPVGETTTWRPDLGAVRSVMIVVDTTNTRPGTSGKVWVKSAALQH